jgi:hypothetical protein
MVVGAIMRRGRPDGTQVLLHRSRHRHHRGGVAGEGSPTGVPLIRSHTRTVSSS